MSLKPNDNECRDPFNLDLCPCYVQGNGKTFVSGCRANQPIGDGTDATYKAPWWCPLFGGGDDE